MHTVELIKKVSDYVQENEKTDTVIFDFDTYENKEDIPHVVYDGEIRYVQKVRFGKSGKSVRLYYASDTSRSPASHGLMFFRADRVKVSQDELDKKMAELRMPDILRDVYYSTRASWLTGEFEACFPESEQ